MSRCAFRSSAGPTCHVAEAPRLLSCGCAHFRAWPAEPDASRHTAPYDLVPLWATALMEFLSLRRLSTGESSRGLPTTWLSVLRVSHPLDGLLLPGTFGLISCRNALGISLFRGFPPASGLRGFRPKIALLAFAPLPGDLGLPDVRRRHRFSGYLSR
jgi:hypothetical protein